MRDWSLAEAHGTTREVLTLYATVSWLFATPEPASASSLLGQAVRNATANGNNKRKLGRLSVLSQSGICLGFSRTFISFRTSWVSDQRRARLAQSLSKHSPLKSQASPTCHHRQCSPTAPYFSWLKWKWVYEQQPGLLPGWLSYTLLCIVTPKQWPPHISLPFLFPGVQKTTRCVTGLSSQCWLECGDGQKYSLEMHWALLAV